MAENKRKTAGRPRKNSSSAGRKTKSNQARSAKVQEGAPLIRTKKLSAEIKGIILISLGLFVMLSFFDLTGLVGRVFKDVVMGLFGGAATIFFLFIIFTGINIFMEKKRKNSGYKIWGLFALMMVTSVLWALWFGDTAWEYNGFKEAIQSMYAYGIDGGGGGVLGTLLCIGLVKFLGTVGTTLVSIAAALILLIVLTEVSFEKIFRTIKLYIEENRQKMAEDLDSEVDVGVTTVREKKKKKKDKKVKQEEAPEVKEEIPPQSPAQNNGYFDVYFSGEDIEKITTPPRFVLEEEPSEDTQAIIDAVNAAHEAKQESGFEIVDVSRGILTSLPDENGNIPNQNGDDFEPPSMIQMEERLDPATQAAIDAGAPLDEAVMAAKRISRAEAEQAAQSINIIAKESIEATKIINYKLPSVSLLAKPSPKTKSRAEVKKELEDKANKLLETLASFKVDARIINITQGPTVTRFELQPGFGIKVSKITNLADDIALSLAASGVRIEAPIPGKSAIGIEIPNESASPVPIREVIDTDKFRDFKSKTAFALGKDIGGNCIIADIAQFPHVLIAGATGSGKSVCINSLITSILYKAKPNEVKMIMVDPKMVELGVYNGIPHLLIPVVTDPKHAAGALNWAVAEMKNRYQLLKDNKVRNIQGYNSLMEENGTPEDKLPEIVIIIDELADLMMAAKNEVEDAINSLAALARAAGMYLVIATQRPSVDVITGVIKANVPSRISFAVSSQVDSRTILDTMGAEKLLGKGDMLYSPRGAIKPIRIQGNFLSDAEIENIIGYIKGQYEAEYDESILEHIEREQEASEEHDSDDSYMRGGERDELFIKAAELALDSGQASVAMLQRRFKVGYQRAARIIDQLEEYRVIGPYEGTKPRQVLITRAELNEMMMNNPD